MDLFFEHYMGSADMGTPGAGHGVEYYTSPLITSSQDGVNNAA